MLLTEARDHNLPVDSFPLLHLWIYFLQVAFSFYEGVWTLKSFLLVQM